VVDEHKVWLHQARLLQIPIPPVTPPSKGELKDWAVSRVKADIRWVESPSRDGGDDLVMHRFDFDEDPLMSARYLPGGKSFVCIHTSGSISLKRIEESAETDEWELSEVSRYDRRNPEGCPAFTSRLNEISYGHFVLVYTVWGDLERYAHHYFNCPPLPYRKA